MGDYFQEEKYLIKIIDHFTQLERIIMIQNRMELGQLMLKFSEKKLKNRIEFVKIMVIKDMEHAIDVLKDLNNQSDEMEFGLQEESDDFDRT